MICACGPRWAKEMSVIGGDEGDERGQSCRRGEGHMPLSAIYAHEVCVVRNDMRGWAEGGGRGESHQRGRRI